jgi:hypothetical protein
MLSAERSKNATMSLITSNTGDVSMLPFCCDFPRQQSTLYQLGLKQSKTSEW